MPLGGGGLTRMMSLFSGRRREASGRDTLVRNSMAVADDGVLGPSHRSDLSLLATSRSFTVDSPTARRPPGMSDVLQRPYSMPVSPMDKPLPPLPPLPADAEFGTRRRSAAQMKEFVIEAAVVVPAVDEPRGLGLDHLLLDDEPDPEPGPLGLLPILASVEKINRDAIRESTADTIVASEDDAAMLLGATVDSRDPEAANPAGDSRGHSTASSQHTADVDPESGSRPGESPAPSPAALPAQGLLPPPASSVMAVPSHAPSLMVWRGDESEDFARMIAHWAEDAGASHGSLLSV
ncbi:hypothetical protein DFJ74DRAFT_658824 [Hyaloraphidium curvatum]|nr:hypothetical protein DFJ74DRAFT_658824 [Hyaloraphidium curvatum]